MSQSDVLVLERRSKEKENKCSRLLLVSEVSHHHKQILINRQHHNTRGIILCHKEVRIMTMDREMNCQKEEEVKEKYMETIDMDPHAKDHKLKKKCSFSPREYLKVLLLLDS
jgi:hypothetical protein